MLDGKRILITGITGSWGYSIVDQILRHYNVKEIRGISRSENNQVIMKRYFSNYINGDKINFLIGDIRDITACDNATKDIDYVIHLAAQKHVKIAEQQPDESIKTNILGTMNMVESSIKNKVKRFIDISTDKACEPLCVYGCCKSIGEKYAINNTGRGTEFVCIRSGNVIGSNGSMIPFFQNLIREDKSVPITNTNMTRFFISPKEITELVLYTLENAKDGEIYVPVMKSVKIMDVVTYLFKKENKSLKYHIIGMFPGEKIHEMLVSKDESIKTYTKDDIFIITKNVINENDVFEYNSKNTLSEEETANFIEEILNEENQNE